MIPGLLTDARETSYLIRSSLLKPNALPLSYRGTGKLDPYFTTRCTSVPLSLLRVGVQMGPNFDAATASLLPFRARDAGATSSCNGRSSCPKNVRTSLE
jgi:hypothetical protein